jgi:hypothetical protein
MQIPGTAQIIRYWRLRVLSGSIVGSCVAHPPRRFVA